MLLWGLVMEGEPLIRYAGSSDTRESLDGPLQVALDVNGPLGLERPLSWMDAMQRQVRPSVSTQIPSLLSLHQRGAAPE